MYILCFSAVQVFPRFFYVSDDSLLSILSNPMSVSSIQPHLVSLFGALSHLSLTQDEGEPPLITAVESTEGERLELLTPVRLFCLVYWDGEVVTANLALAGSEGVYYVLVVKVAYCSVTNYVL